MTVGANVPDELEKLLADVQRTIRENDQFIRHLKDEAASAEENEDADSEAGEDNEGYEEL